MVDIGTPLLTHLGIIDGRVVCRGAAALARPALERLDASHLLVTSGLIDTHTHLGWAGRALCNVNADLARSGEGLLAEVRRATGTGAAHAWITGGRWDRSRLPDDALPTRAELDAASQGRPVFLQSEDQATALANTLALERFRLLDIDAGGISVDRDADGTATGRLRGRNARALATAGVVPPRSTGHVADEIAAATRELVRRGVTEVHDIAAPGEDPGAPPVWWERSFTDLAALRRLAETGRLPLRVGIRASLHRVESLPTASWWPRVDDQRLFGIGLKVFVAQGGLTHVPGVMGHSFRYPGRDLTSEWIRDAHALGMPVSAHALGDLDVSEALACFEAAGATGQVPHRLVHAYAMAEADIARTARLGIVVECQPYSLIETADWRGRGDQAGVVAHPWKRLLDAGVPLVFGSDWRSVEHADLRAADPRVGMAIAVERRLVPDDPPWGPRDGVTPAQALHAYTSAAARSAGETGRRADLREGSAADLVVWSEDFIADPARLHSARALVTVVEGLVEHEM